MYSIYIFMWKDGHGDFQLEKARRKQNNIKDKSQL